MTDGLGLSGLRFVRVRPSAEGSVLRQVEVEATVQPTTCPRCSSPKLYRHSPREQRYADVPHLGEPTELVILRRRWRCTGCRLVFPDPLPDMDERRRATTRLLAYAGKRALNYTFAEVARDVGLSDVSIRHIFDDMVADLERRYRFVTPTVLGIDELKIIGQYRCILTNVERNTVYDILDSRKMDRLRRYFRGFPEREKVHYVVADLWGNYAMVAKEFFPHAMLVIDRFHVQRMGSTSIEAVRKHYRKSLTKTARIALKDDRFLLLAHRSNLGQPALDALDELLLRHPDLREAWECKERFHAIWTARTRLEASARMTEWIASVPEDLHPFFREAMAALATRREEILNYFDMRVTNAYTESINRLGKTINRMGRGYSLEVVRAKMLFDPRAIEKGALVVRDAPSIPHRPSDRPTLKLMGLATNNNPFDDRLPVRKLYYGAHIPTLCDLLERGAFE